MKKACIAALVSFAVFSGCGVGTEVDEQEVGHQRSALRSVYPLPVMPAKPTAYVKGMKTYPKTIRSAVTYVEPAATAGEFEAWGFDVETRECFFYVRGDVAAFNSFEQDVEGALDLVPKGNPTYLGSIIQGQPKVGPRVGGGGNPAIWAHIVNAL
ncbi:MAG: hypothetical protein ACO1OB_01600 [Archangium sp.]